MGAAKTTPISCLVGPTASGKTGVGIALAQALDAEIICCDAFAVYRGMEILTAAPNNQAGVPHHLVSMLDPSDTYSAARFLEDADRCVAEIQSRRRTVLIVGGTALYLRGFIAGFGAPVPRDDAYRAALAKRAEDEGPDVLHQALLAVDPVRAAELHPNDLRRVVRALEIARATQQQPSALRGEWDAPPRVESRVVCLSRSPDELARRIEVRAREMFRRGVLEEARALLERPLSPEASKVLGLAELGALLSGSIDQPEAEARIAQRTRRLARKQMTFFRSFPGVVFVAATEADSDLELARRVRRALEAQDA